MVLLPKATKTSLVKLVRSKGYEVPSIRQARFWGNNRSRYYHSSGRIPNGISTVPGTVGRVAARTCW